MECQDLISSLLTLDPKERPSIYEVQGHPWMMGLASMKSLFEDRIIETDSPEKTSINNSPVKLQKKLSDIKKKLPALPKRFER